MSPPPPPPLSEKVAMIGSQPHIHSSFSTLPTTRRKQPASIRMESHDLHSSSIPSNNSSSSSCQGQTSTEQWSALDISGLGLRNLSLNLWTHFPFLTSLFLGGNCLTSISPQIYKLKSLETLDISNNNLKSLPPELGRMVWLRKLDLFHNYINLIPVEFGYLYQLECFVVDDNPLVEPLFSINESQGGLAVISFLRDNNNLANAGSHERKWITIPGADSSSCFSQELVSLFSFNILSERFAVSRIYGYVPSWALEWNYRREMIVNEIVGLNADLVLLQELDLGLFDDYFKSQLGAKFIGYESVFLPKSRSRTMTEQERKTVDGCATFFKTSRFKLKESYAVEFSQLASKKPEITKNEESFQRLILKDNVALITRFVDLAQNGRQFVVANVHLHWNPEFKDVKLIQCILLMEELDKIMAKHPQAHLIVAGDFNSTPDSGVFRFLSQGHIAPDDPDFCGFSYPPYTNGQSNDFTVYTQHSKPVKNSGASHSQFLRSAYSAATTTKDVSKMYTSITPWFSGHIDYIWYSCGSSSNTATLTPTGVLGTIPDEYTSKIVGLPTQHFPSDHISLMAEFKISDTSAQSPQMHRSGSGNIGGYSKQPASHH